MAQERLKANKVYRVWGSNGFFHDGDTVILSKDGGLATSQGVIKKELVDTALRGVEIREDCSMKVSSRRGSSKISMRKQK